MTKQFKIKQDGIIKKHTRREDLQFEKKSREFTRT